MKSLELFYRLRVNRMKFIQKQNKNIHTISISGGGGGGGGPSRFSIVCALLVSGIIVYNTNKIKNK